MTDQAQHTGMSRHRTLHGACEKADGVVTLIVKVKDDLVCMTTKRSSNTKRITVFTPAVEKEEEDCTWKYCCQKARWSARGLMV